MRPQIDLFRQKLPLELKPTKKKKSREKKIHVTISEYIKLQYPGVIFFSDASGVRLTMGQSITLKRMRAADCKIPDMIILEPRGPYAGLLLEIKDDKDSPYLKDGTLSKSQHIQEQAETLDRLKHKGYATFFAVGVENGKQIIDNYMAYGPRH